MIIYTNPKDSNNRNYWVYVLKLEYGKYYVGIARDIDERFKMHQLGVGAKWTKIYKPIKIIERISTPYYFSEPAERLEDKTTLRLMKKYGKDNVRGGHYCAVDQDIIDKELGNKLDSPKKKKKSKTIVQVKESRELRALSNYEIYVFRRKGNLLIYNKQLIPTKLVDKQISLGITGWIDHKKKIIWMSWDEFNDNREVIIQLFGLRKIHHILRDIR